jgi:CubicO group peptidase (beta-lactamase class C family)
MRSDAAAATPRSTPRPAGLALALALVLALGAGVGGVACSDDGSGAEADPDAVATDAVADGDAVDALARRCTAAQLTALESSMRTTLNAAATNPSITRDPNFTVLLEADDGRRFTHAHGTSSATTRYESASTSKWVTAAVLLDLVDRGVLSLTTKAHQHLPFWTESAVDLRDLLSFTSGFNDEPACVNSPFANFAACVEQIHDDNVATAPAPETDFHYSGTHMQVAGLMAIRAAGVASWTALFSAFKARTGLFPTSSYNLPSASNPRLGGGMTWTGEEYLGFLRALVRGTLLQSATRAALFANQRGAAVVTASPAFQSMGEDWAYGLGNWLECPGATTPNSYNCGSGHRNSSAGAYGAYPFIDFDHDYFGIVARQGSLGSGDEGVAIARTIANPARQWATRLCD